jgi:hypothetical protein
VVDFDETKGVVTVGTSVVSEELQAELQEPYGPLVRLEQAEPTAPA